MVPSASGRRFCCARCTSWRGGERDDNTLRISQRADYIMTYWLLLCLYTHRCSPRAPAYSHILCARIFALYTHCTNAPRDTTVVVAFNAHLQAHCHSFLEYKRRVAAGGVVFLCGDVSLFGVNRLTPHFLTACRLYTCCIFFLFSVGRGDCLRR